MYRFFLLLMVLFVSTTACHKHEAHDHSDKDAPTLVIESPTADAVLSGVVDIRGKVTDKSLHELKIVLTHDADGREVFKKQPNVHNKTVYDFKETFTPSGLSGETAMTLTVTVEDHSSNKTVRSVKFKVKP